MNFINWFDVGTHKPKIKKRDKEFFGYKKYVKPKKRLKFQYTLKIEFD